MTKQLLRAWLILMGLSIGTMIAGKVTNTRHLGLIWLGALLLVTFFKTRIILYDYLELKTAYGNWGRIFLSLSGGVLLTVFCIYAYGDIVLHI